MPGEWDLDKMEKMEEDCLEFLRILFIDLYLHRYTKICSYIFLTFHIPIWAQQFYQYVKTFDLLMMAQYGPASFVFLYAFVSMLIPIMYEENVREYFKFKKESYWSLNTASDELKQKLLKHARNMVLIAKVNLVLAFTTYITYLLKATRNTNWEIIYQVTLFKTMFPGYSHILIVIFYASLSYMIIPMVLMIYLMTYASMHLYYQSNILSEHVTRITENYHNHNELFDDKAYQKQVFQRLRFCIMRGMILKSAINQQLTHVHPLIVVYTILGMCLIVCYVGSWHLIKDKYYPSIIMLVITSGFTCLMLIEVGQMVEEESVEAYSRLCELPWYTFNISNQKIALSIMLTAATEIKISPFRDFPVNRTLIVQFYKVASSVYALAVNMGDRINL